MDATNTAEQGSPSGGAREMAPELIRDMILHILRIYPIINPTMLQNALGPSLKAALWRPVLDEMMNEELVDMTQVTILTPHGRYNSYKRLYLTDAGEKLARAKAEAMPNVTGQAAELGQH